MRLNVFLAHNGIGSRRTAFDLVKTARVKVNGRVIMEPSTDVSEKDQITVDGHPVQAQRYVYLVLNKMFGYVTTKSDPHAERIVTDLLPEQYQHLQPVGRLDKDTEGLLLFTNDGATAQTLTHPKFEKQKTYHATVEGRVTMSQKDKLEAGILIDGEKTAPAKVIIIRPGDDYSECRITIHEGKKRQVRRMFAAVGHRVERLTRLTFGPLKLGELKPGQWRLLTEEEVKALKRDEA